MFSLLVGDGPTKDLIHGFRHHQAVTGRQGNEGVWPGFYELDEIGIEHEDFTV